MAAVAIRPFERRQECRVAGGGRRFGADAVLRPGQTVVLVNISSRGALVESGGRLRPGAHADLHLCGRGTRARVIGRLERCQVVRLEPICYRGAIVFDERLEIGSVAEGSG